ncbi:RING-H2 finger protein ATL80-like [Euphorbia lathyris]|uniref:RING-H2 finger protein ATL80-like n=1 Tax=Euphorbia lathyris TaxID=212925 RepID=UPI0033140155
MPRPLRFLGADIPSPTTPSAEQPATLDSDFVVILAALLCALICVLGLVAVARCAWLRRLSSAANSQTPPQPAFPAAANKGLKKKVLRSLPKETLSADSVPKFSDCVICLAEFAAGDEIRILPQCGHGFHVSCIDTWLGSHSSCPSCRQILVVARCQKCGGVPAPASSSGGGGGGGGEGESECRVKEREDVVNRFLP